MLTLSATATAVTFTEDFETTIADGAFRYARREQIIAREAQLDGLYVIRTSEPAERLSAHDTVRSYKDLSRVERVFRCLKGIDLLVRPIHHRKETRVRAHLLLCGLAYYVEWHMRKALAALLFDGEMLDEQRWRGDPVLPAKPSASAQREKVMRETAEGFTAHSFETLLTEPTPLQKHALELVTTFPVASTSNA